MAQFIANQVIVHMGERNVPIADSKILLLGCTFKENCPDIRNTKIVDIYHTLYEYTQNITIYDPWANADQIKREYGIDLSQKPIEFLKNQFDVVILCVAHRDFKELNVRDFLVNKSEGVVYDVKGVLDRNLIDGRL